MRRSLFLHTLIWLRLLFLIVFGGLWAVHTSASEGRQTLRSGWYLWDPYQFTEVVASQPKLTGLDVELVRAIATKAGYTVDYQEVSWHQHLEDIKTGVRDMAAGATYNPQRAEYAHFSIPYRTETNVLYLPRGEAKKHDFTDVAGMLSFFKENKFRLGVIDGFVFADPRVNEYVADPANASLIVKVGNDYDNFRNLIDQRIDGFLADRIAASTTAWRGNWRQFVEAHPLQFSVPIHLMFSKKTISTTQLAVMNNAIEELRGSGEFSRIVSNYMFPVLLQQTLDQDWFFIVDVVGVIAFAISGVVLANRGNYDIFGALLLASLPAVGGGVIRDLIVGRSPVGLTTSPIYLGLIGGTVLIGFLVLRLLPLTQKRSHIDPQKTTQVFNLIVEIFDAVGLAAFTVVGVVVAVSTRLEPLWLWGSILAMITGAGGGIVRDMVRQDGEIACLKGAIYPEIALIWGLILSMVLIWQTTIINPDHIFIAIVLTMIGAFVTRMLIVWLGIRCPLYR